MGAIGEADRGGSARNLLHGDDMRQIAHARAAEIRIGGDAQQSQLAEFLPQMGGKLVLAVRFLRQRSDALLRKAAHHIAQRLDIVA